jgi:hypothetical protein
MDTEEEIEEARRLVQQAEARVTAQKQTIAVLQRDGRPTGDEKAMLASLEGALAACLETLVTRLRECEPAPPGSEGCCRPSR